jgi:hypothetical protein
MGLFEMTFPRHNGDIPGCPPKGKPPSNKMRESLMSEKRVVSVELYDQDIQLLEEMVKKFQIADVSKALRCLVSFAREKKELESEIFEMIRCDHC